MIFALLFVLLIFLLIEYRLFFHYVLHPAIIVTGVFFLSTFFSAANYSSWGDISGTTFGVILVAILLFCIGCICGDTIVVKKNKKSCNYAKLSNFFIPKGITVMIIIFMAIITALDFNDVRSVSQVNSMGIVDAVMNARNLLYTGETSISHTFLIQQGLYISRMVAYVYIFIIYYQRIIMSIRPRIINYIPIVLYFIQAFLSTGRTEFMYIIYAWLLIGYLIKLRKNSGRRNVDIKYSGKILLALGIFLIIFLLIANMRKSDSVDMFSTLSIYIGSPINALDYYITENGLWSVSNFWGEETQSLCYSILKALGLSDKTSVYVLPPVLFGPNSTMTNIYTSVRRYLHDFGIIGMGIIMLVLGCIYSKIFRIIKSSNFKIYGILAYTFISYPLIEFSIEERFFSTLVTARTVYCLFYLAIICKFLIKRTKYNNP